MLFTCLHSLQFGTDVIAGLENDVNLFRDAVSTALSLVHDDVTDDGWRVDLLTLVVPWEIAYLRTPVFLE